MGSKFFTSAWIYLQSAVYKFVNKITNLLTNTPPEKGGGQKEHRKPQYLRKRIIIMKNMDTRKMETADMETVVGGAKISILPLDLEAAKEAVDCIGKPSKDEPLIARGKC